MQLFLVGESFDVVDVSILTPPESGMQPMRGYLRYARTSFNLHPARKRDTTVAIERAVDLNEVSILIPPEDRMQRTVDL